MTRAFLGAFFAAGLLAAACCSACSRAEGSAPLARSTSTPERVVSAPGTVEPVSEEIAVSSELPGKLEKVFVEEGSRVKRGQVIAVLVNREYAAAVDSAKATLMDREAALRRVVNGARTQERREAHAALEAAEAVLANAVAVRDRRRVLLEQGAISMEEAERTEEAWRVAAARRWASAERDDLVNDRAREEDEAQARAAVELARAAVARDEAMLEKTYLRSPIDGVILKRRHLPGETVGNAPGDPIVTIGDISRLRVRVEVDELDVAHVRTGQRVRVHADGFGKREFLGTIATVGQALGKKNIHTDEPAERLDAKVLEVLVDLDSNEGLRPRLRVDVFIDARGQDDSR
jgi:HlyD family secretion protein